ncbi:hypothetical protein ZIOFF_065555 [Zingiber officinale]|uniref:Uncharacterized protein n=1 Tax=Zingiber officinale TaxID=94328 RepID=A0A8J5F0L7_ZINOF|nr:hypothetical protein ZIOFF_065555 [Zingiber officinale]
MNFQDLELIRKIKKIIKELPDLSIPPNDCFIIIEADGCIEGWGGICKWKPKKYDSNSEEKICAYSRSWTPAAKDLLILAQIEEALLQIKDKPNLMASQHLAGLMSSFNNMKNWPATREKQVSTTKKNTTNALTWPTSSGQQPNTSLAALESLNLSASSRNQISAKEATTKDKTPIGKKPYQLSMKQGLNYSKYSSTCNASHSS